MCGSNMFRDVRDHGGPPLQVFMEEVGAELGINDAASEDRQSRDGKYRNDRDKQIGDDQPVAQAPEQPASPPGHKADEKIDSREDSQVFDEVENAAAQPKKFDKQPDNNDGRA